MEDLTVEQRMTLIEQRHADLAQHVTILSEMQEKSEKRWEEIQERMEEMQKQRAESDKKIDKRIGRLFGITLRIGADFAERLRKLEEEEEE